MKTKEIKRREAEKRQKDYKKRTPEEQLVILNIRGSKAIKERKKLLEKIKKSGKKENK